MLADLIFIAAMNSSRLLIVIINFNGAKFLPACLDSLAAQTYRSSRLAVIDNGSSDESLAIVRSYPQAELILNAFNNGYAGAADQSCRLAADRGAEFLMLLNPDIVFAPDYIARVLQVFQNRPLVASAQGKLLQYDFARSEKRSVIDSAGLLCYRNRRVVDRGQGETDRGQYDRGEAVFGVTGACPIMRVAALADIKIDDEYYDRDFFMYKEDIDLSWRFLLAGWENRYEPTALAWHGRGTGVLKRHSHYAVMKSRAGLSALTKYHSYKNQRWMQIKNEIPALFFRQLPAILCKEVLIAGYILLREPVLLKSFWELLLKLPRMIRKRRLIQALRRAKGVDAARLARWFV